MIIITLQEHPNGQIIGRFQTNHREDKDLVESQRFEIKDYTIGKREKMIAKKIEESLNEIKKRSHVKHLKTII